MPKFLDPSVNSYGAAISPEGITEIRDNAFDGNKKLRTVRLPNTVKRLGCRCFADCTNLTELVLNDGLEAICHNVFTTCDSLTSIVIPDTVKTVEAFTFYQSSFQDPVFNTSGDTLYRCLDVPGRKEYTVSS